MSRADIEPALLAALIGPPAHGYAISRRLRSAVDTDLPEGTVYPALHRLEPTCAEAAAAHHYDEVVDYRLAAGLLGLLGLGVYRYARRRSQPPIGTLPDGFVPITGTAVFGLAAAALIFQGLAPLPTGSSAGAGQWLSAGVVALAVAGCYALRVVRVLAVHPG